MRDHRLGELHSRARALIGFLRRLADCCTQFRLGGLLRGTRAIAAQTVCTLGSNFAALLGSDRHGDATRYARLLIHDFTNLYDTHKFRAIRSSLTSISA
ncbi:MAG: hypothetical protein M4D80_37805 [Myxococcota bacterium]|nr:hypothetical protein [Deltaproteobacteria bacterium]MDQ3340948.1 hypothetical protein [Myxococcota bacterium]